MKSARRRLGVAVVVASLLSFAAVVLVSQLSHADARTDYLVRILRTSEAFRVRAQAALSLGSVTPEPQVTQALTEALRDDNPAVRAAAASSLGRVGDASSVAALRALERDSEPAVRTAATSAIASLQRAGSSRTAGSSGSGTSGSGSSGATTGTTGGSSGGGAARYYVGVGVPGTKIARLDPATLRTVRGSIERTVSGVSGVVVAPDGETASAAQRVLRERSLSGFYLDSSIVSVEPRDGGGIRAQVSVIIQSYPDRNVRSMLSGAATVMGASGPDVERQAIEAAFQSALRNLSTALAASAGTPR